MLEVERALQEGSNPAIHYDAAKEVRARGAAFYQFSKDEETRRVQMEELRNAREATGQARREPEAFNEKPGTEKRKRDMEERRKAIEAKRRKVKAPTTLSLPVPTTTTNTSSGEKDSISLKQTVLDEVEGKNSLARSIPLSADEFLAAVEREMIKKHL